MVVTVIGSGKKLLVNPETLEVKSGREKNVRYEISGMYLVEEDGEVRFEESYGIDPIKNVKKGDVVFLSYTIGGKRYACVVHDTTLFNYIDGLQKAIDDEDTKRKTQSDTEEPATF